ncbi:MAG: outer membrane protein [Gammaproteobacteria bacterium]|jgi:outer membrane protein
MNSRVPLLAVFLFAVTGNLVAQGGPPEPKESWSVSVGAGSIYSPSYEGDDENRLMVIPNFRVTYGDDFFASVGEGIGYNLINKNRVKFGPIVKYNFGRDEDASSSFAIGGDDTDDLRGLGDVDGSLEVGAYLESRYQTLTGKVEVRQGLGGHGGLVGEASLSFNGLAKISDQRLIYSIGPRLKFTSAEYNESYFSVSAAQSAASGLAQYNADDYAVSYGLGGNLIVPHTKKFSTIIFADFRRLGETISDSSLVSQRGDKNQGSMGLFVNYKF